MTYISKLKKNTNIGRLFYANTGVLMMLMILLIIPALIFAAYATYIGVNDIGYGSFSKNNKPGIAAELKIEKLSTIITDSQNNLTYCIFDSQGQKGIILVPNELLETKLGVLLSDKPDTAIVVHGLTRSFDNQLIDFIRSDRYLAYLDGVYGDVYLDISVSVYSPQLMPSIITMIVFVLAFILVYVVATMHDAKLFRRLSQLESVNESAISMLDTELSSHGNFAISPTVILTNSFYVNSKTCDILFIKNISWCYLEKIGNIIQLSAHTTDGKKHVLVRNTRKNNTVSNVLFDELCNRGVEIRGNSKESKDAYKEIVKTNKIQK